jgi:hypothetical protein
MQNGYNLGEIITHGAAGEEWIMETLTVLKFNTARVQKSHLTWLWMKRVSKAVLIGAVLPLTPRIPTNPCGISIEVFDHLHAAVKAYQGRHAEGLQGRAARHVYDT